MFATATGSSRCCTSCAARSSRCRTISESAKLGRSTTSASKSSPASSRPLGTWIEALAPSKLAVVPSWAPRNAASSATSKALRAPAPCCSIVAVKVARPGTPDGSRAAPASSRSCTSTTGTLCISTTAIMRPFGSIVVCTAGSLSAGGAGSAGGLVRSIAWAVRRTDGLAVSNAAAAEAAHALHPRQELRLEGDLGPLHLPRRRTLVGDLLQLLVDHPLQLAEVVAAAGGGIDLEFAVDATAILERHHVRRDLQLVHQPSIEA